ALNQEYLDYFKSNGMQYVSSYETDFIRSSFQYLHQAHQLNILDMGCGPGRILKILSELKNPRLFGVDISEEMIKAALDNLNNIGISAEIIQNNFSNGLPFDNNYFDLITAIRCIKYNANWKDILFNVHSKLKEGGIFTFTHTNKYFAGNFLKFLSNNAKEHPQSKKRIQDALQELGFEIITFDERFIIPMAFYRMCRFEQNTNVLLNIEKILGRLPLINQMSQFFYIICRK
ncbi:MAG: class I SAM-dependent methyltransferase, partial [Candidatus Omnitrophica bacterium]|nr:class I SAM-dependent methyltransferase [Candidatus Omnitrophota bacterium]